MTMLGAAIVSLPIALALWKPGHTLTRHVVAAGQMLVGALLIHLSGGRIETHFHVFGSLAFLAFDFLRQRPHHRHLRERREHSVLEREAKGRKR